MAFLLLWPHLAHRVGHFARVPAHKRKAGEWWRNREEIWPVIVCFPFDVSAKRFLWFFSHTSGQLSARKKAFPQHFRHGPSSELFKRKLII